MNYKEFAKRIKSKHSAYANIDDMELARAIVKKYPDAYGDIDFEDGPDMSQQRESMVGQIKQFYRGDFDKLLKNRGKLNALVSEGKLTRTQAQKARELLNAYDTAMSVEDREEFEALAATDNPYLQKSAKTALYKEELQGEPITAKRVVAPELTRRQEMGEGVGSQFMGGAKDALTLIPRMIRPVIQEAAGMPGVGYLEEVGRPSMYKTGEQEMFDEVFQTGSLAGAPIKAGRAAMRPLLGQAATKGGRAAKILTGVEEPAGVVLGRIGSPTALGGKQLAARSAMEAVPETAIEAGFELTRPEDEVLGDVDRFARTAGTVLGGLAAPAVMGGVRGAGPQNIRLSEYGKELADPSKLKYELRDLAEYTPLKGSLEIGEDIAGQQEALKEGVVQLAQKRAGDIQELEQRQAGEMLGREKELGYEAYEDLLAPAQQEFIGSVEKSIEDLPQMDKNRVLVALKDIGAYDKGVLTPSLPEMVKMRTDLGNKLGNATSQTRESYKQAFSVFAKGMDEAMNAAGKNTNLPGEVRKAYKEMAEINGFLSDFTDAEKFDKMLNRASLTRSKIGLYGNEFISNLQKQQRFNELLQEHVDPNQNIDYITDAVMQRVRLRTFGEDIKEVTEFDKLIRKVKDVFLGIPADKAKGTSLGTSMGQFLAELATDSPQVHVLNGVLDDMNEIIKEEPKKVPMSKATQADRLAGTVE